MLISLIFSYLFLLIEINSHLFCPMDYILLLHYHLPTFVAQIVPVLIFRSSIKLTALSFKHACSVAQSCPTLCDLIDCSTPGFPILHYLLQFAQTHIHWVDYVIQTFCHSLLLLPTIFHSLRIFPNELHFHIRWPKYWIFSISPSNEYLWLISFRIDWFCFLGVQGTINSVLQHHS